MPNTPVTIQVPPELHAKLTKAKGKKRTIQAQILADLCSVYDLPVAVPKVGRPADCHSKWSDDKKKKPE